MIITCTTDVTSLQLDYMHRLIGNVVRTRTSPVANVGQKIKLCTHTCTFQNQFITIQILDVPLYRGRDSMSKVGGLGVHEVGGYLFVIYIHSEYIRHRLLVFNKFFMTTSNFGGLSPPLIKKWGGSSCPRFSAI